MDIAELVKSATDAGSLEDSLSVISLAGEMEEEETAAEVEEAASDRFQFPAMSRVAKIRIL